jgi:phage tail-like protein
MTDFAALLLRSLPGIYRQKDEATTDLARFLEIAASPLTETEASIGQLHDDLFGASARGDFLPLIGGLIGAEIDPTLPASLQRAALADTLPFYRSKGLALPLENTVQAFTGWQTITVDYSQVVARVPFIETLSPLVRQRRRPVGVVADRTDRFTFDPTGRIAALFDELRGRAIARTEIASLAADLVGTDRGFAVRENGVDLVGPGAPAPRTVVAANLTDFDHPLKLDGTALTIAAGQIAIDPELGRLLFGAPVPLAGNLSVDFHQLLPSTVALQTLDLRDSQRMTRIGRSDDPAPYTVDLRAPSRPTERIGRTHFDNHGLFLTVGRRMESRRPNLLRAGPPAAFSFDDRPLAAGDVTGNTLQLQDGIDGAPITTGTATAVGRFVDHEADYVDTPRGFTIRARGISLLDPSFGSGTRVVAANLADPANPRNPHDPSGATPLALLPRDIAVDPQRGRFVLNLDAFSINAEDVRVSYLLANAVRTTGGATALVGPAGSNTWSFAADGRAAALRDALDGTPLRAKIRLGASLITDFAGTPRGFRIFVGATDVTSNGTLTAQDVAIEGPRTALAGQLLVDVERGRFALPAASVPAGAVVTVDYSAADSDAEGRVFVSLAQRLPGLVPAGVVPVVVDSRKPFVDLSNFVLAAKANTP